MPTDKDAEAGGRGSRELWLGAAYEALVEAGVDAVRIQPLAKRVGLARTSFYWFFSDRESLLDALLDLWRAKNSGNLIRRTEAYAETLTEAILNVCDCWLDGTLFDAQFEFAVRSWALQSPAAAGAVAEADALRLAAMEALFVRFGIAPDAAEVRARAIYLTQIGYISMKSSEDLALRMRRIPHYVAIFTGSAPQGREMARFHARHGFVDRTSAKR